MMLTWSLLAAEARVRTTFEWGRIQSNSDWILPIAVLILLLLFVRYMYRRDAVELPRPLGWFLTALRTIVFLALFILWLQPQWRTEEQKVIPSRALVLVDTSLSMGLNDADNGSTQATSRLRQVAQALKQSDFLDRLRKTHDVVVGQFDEELHRDRVLTLPRAKDESPPVERPAASSVAKAAPADTATEAPTDWEQILALSGEETRLGQSVRQLLSDHANAPTSAVIVISDGGQNAGPGPDFAAEAAKELGVRIFTVGVGSEHQPPSVRVAAFNPPPRAYPGDPYTISGVVQAWRMPGRTIQVQLLSRPAANGAPDPSARGSGELIDSQQVTLGTDGEEVPVKFEVTTEEI
ncbi:MAG: vWA domain-containing protein, partial [Planctomycetota bacterium]